MTGFPPAPTLMLRGQAVDQGAGAVMAIINRTTDSFYDGARHNDDAHALEAVALAEREGARIVDIGGVRAGIGPEVTPAQEIDRVVPFIAQVRQHFPDLLVSVDTWRSQVAREAALAGVDLINDTWAGHDPEIVSVAAEFGLGGGVLPHRRQCATYRPGQASFFVTTAGATGNRPS